VRIAVGPIEELMQTIPGYLPNIAFCRRGDPRVRRWPLEKFLRKVYRKRELSQGTSEGKE
jgi:hypothetical protein